MNSKNSKIGSNPKISKTSQKEKNKDSVCKISNGNSNTFNSNLDKTKMIEVSSEQQIKCSSSQLQDKKPKLFPEKVRKVIDLCIINKSHDNRRMRRQLTNPDLLRRAEMNDSNSKVYRIEKKISLVGSSKN